MIILNEILPANPVAEILITGGYLLLLNRNFEEKKHCIEGRISAVRFPSGSEKGPYFDLHIRCSKPVTIAQKVF